MCVSKRCLKLNLVPCFLFTAKITKTKNNPPKKWCFFCANPSNIKTTPDMFMRCLCVSIGWTSHQKHLWKTRRLGLSKRFFFSDGFFGDHLISPLSIRNRFVIVSFNFEKLAERQCCDGSVRCHHDKSRSTVPPWKHTNSTWRKLDWPERKA